MERWIGSLRRVLLDRMLRVNARHLMRVLAEYETHFNTTDHTEHSVTPLRYERSPSSTTPRSRSYDAIDSAR